TPREGLLFTVIETRAWKEMLIGFSPMIGGGKNIMPLHDVWLESRYRRQYAGIVLAPPGSDAAPNDYYNLWIGKWAVPPLKPALCGGWERMKSHLYEVVCKRDDKSWDYLRKWIAFRLQNPGIKIGVAIVLKGKKGVGKTIVANYLARIF